MANIYNMVNLKNYGRDNENIDDEDIYDEDIDIERNDEGSGNGSGGNNEGSGNGSGGNNEGSGNGSGGNNEGSGNGSGGNNEGRDIDNDFYINMNNNCMICLEEINNFNPNSKLPCGCINSFHGKCLKEWFNLNNYCPICRKNIIRRIVHSYNRNPINICAGTIIMGLFTTYFLFLLQAI